MSAISQIPPEGLANLPAASPPPGARPNFVDPPSYEHSIIALEAGFMTLMGLAVAVRVFVRARITKVWGWDDYTCIVAALGSLAHAISYTEMLKVGFGRHMWDIRALELIKAHNFRVLSSNGIIYAFCIYFAKLSILLQYLRIFKVDRLPRLAIYSGMAFMTLYYPAFIGVAIGSVVKCSGLAAGEVQFCLNYARPVTVMNAVINVVTDLYIFIVPIPCVLKLQLNRRRRIGLLIVFATWLVVFAASLTRMSVFCAHYHDPDTLWIQGRNAQYTIVEINVAILVACTSCFPSFFKQSKVFSSDVYLFLRSRISYTKPSSRGSAKSASKANGDWAKDRGLLHTEAAANAIPTSRGSFELKEAASTEDSRVNLETPNGTRVNKTAFV